MASFQGRGRGGDGGGRDRGGGGGRGRDGGGRDFGGGGGRDFGGGRGGPDRPGLTGRNRHMGDMPSIMGLAGAQGMGDADIIKILNPPLADRNRSALVDPRAPAFTQTSVLLPLPAAWRTAQKIGKVLDPTRDIIRTNHFALDTKKIPGTIYQYAVHVYNFDKTGNVSKENSAPTMDIRESTALIMTLRKKMTNWATIQNLGLAYDGKSNIFTTQVLPLPGANDIGEPYLEEDIFLAKIDGTGDSKNKFRICLTLVSTINCPHPESLNSWSSNDNHAILGLEAALLAFAKWQVVEESPPWFLVGSQVFKSNGNKFPLSAVYIAMRGFHVSLRTVMSGLTLVTDMVVNCFLTGGEMTEVMAFASGYRGGFEEFLNNCKRGLPPHVVSTIEKSISSSKVVIKYLGQWRKCKFIGPPANSPASKFCASDGKSMTVADYFVMMCKDKDKGKEYSKVLPLGKLKFPELPTVNIGSKSKPILIPSELVMVPGGQCRMQVQDPEVSQNHIRYSAVRPDERMKFLADTTGEGSVINVLRNDPTAKTFGLTGIAPSPIATQATLLPSPKLLYGRNAVFDPKFSGSWNMERLTFYKSACPVGSIPFAVIVVGSRPPPRDNWKESIQSFIGDVERDSASSGCAVKMFRTPIVCSPDPRELSAKFQMCVDAKVGFCFCIMVDTDCYGPIKLAADSLGMITQCLKWKNVDRPPKSFHFNLLVKINTKCGGTNHVLNSRLPGGKLPPGSPSVFQDPPCSLSWLFDKPCMLVGIDVSHPEFGATKDSAAAVVASMDGRASQYAAFLSAQTPGQEMVTCLEESMEHLLKLFRDRNEGKMPETMVIFRDGVSDGQFDKVTTTELPAVKNALMNMGMLADSIKIAIVICQKRHHTKLAYEDRGQNGEVEYINLCPGVVVDGSSANSIASPYINEFYLNSHIAIQGTARACKYSLIYDEIGFKISELELLTYWTTYLYCRCTKSVSYATPAYYAHWASRRGRYLFAAGAGQAELLHISRTFADSRRKAIMFYV